MSVLVSCRDKISYLFTTLYWMMVWPIVTVYASVQCREEGDEEDDEYWASEPPSQAATCKCGKEHTSHIQVVRPNDEVDTSEALKFQPDAGAYHIFLEVDGDILANKHKLAVYEEFATGRDKRGRYLGSWKRIPECLQGDLVNPCSSCGDQKAHFIFEPPYGSKPQYSCNRLGCRAHALQYLLDRLRGVVT